MSRVEVSCKVLARTVSDSILASFSISNNKTYRKLSHIFWLIISHTRSLHSISLLWRCVGGKETGKFCSSSFRTYFTCEIESHNIKMDAVKLLTCSTQHFFACFLESITLQQTLKILSGRDLILLSRAVTKLMVFVC